MCIYILMYIYIYILMYIYINVYIYINIYIYNIILMVYIATIERSAGRPCLPLSTELSVSNQQSRMICIPAAWVATGL